MLLCIQFLMFSNVARFKCEFKYMGQIRCLLHAFKTSPTTTVRHFKIQIWHNWCLDSLFFSTQRSQSPIQTISWKSRFHGCDVIMLECVNYFQCRTVFSEWTSGNNVTSFWVPDIHRWNTYGSWLSYVHVWKVESISEDTDLANRHTPRHQHWTEERILYQK